jgi:hypothetical protein
MPLTIEIKVSPRSGKQTCILDKAGKLKCYLKSPPEQGKANMELIKFIAKSLGLPQDKVSIISGQTSRNKILKIEAPLTFEAILMHLGIEKQKSLFEE